MERTGERERDRPSIRKTTTAQIGTKPKSRTRTPSRSPPGVTGAQALAPSAAAFPWGALAGCWIRSRGARPHIGTPTWDTGSACYTTLAPWGGDPKGEKTKLSRKPSTRREGGQRQVSRLHLHPPTPPGSLRISFARGWVSR